MRFLSLLSVALLLPAPLPARCDEILLYLHGKSFVPESEFIQMRGTTGRRWAICSLCWPVAAGGKSCDVLMENGL